MIQHHLTDADKRNATSPVAASLKSFCKTAVPLNNVPYPMQCDTTLLKWYLECCTATSLEITTVTRSEYYWYLLNST